MANKIYNMLFSVNAELGKEFGSTFSSANRALTETQKEIQSLNRTQSDISSYQKQQQAVSNTARKLEVLKQQHDNTQREFHETGSKSSELQNRLLSQEEQIRKTTDALNRQNQSLDEMGKNLRENGVDTNNLNSESERLDNQLEELAEQSGNFGTNGVNAFTAINDALITVGLATALKEIGEAYKECVSLAGDFGETMSTVEALSGATESEMVTLSDLAKELGATTKFTAVESAEAMTYMAMAGWKAEEMVAGMDGVLQLAAASGEDLATTADIVTDNLTAFGLSAADTAHFSDVLAAAATNSNTSVSIMGETFKYSAALAGALNYSIEDVATAVGLMANAGIKGSNAGTALKNIFNGLLDGVTLNSEAFGEFEYSAMNADGTMKSFKETMQDLRGLFAQMTGAEQLLNAKTLAGKYGMTGFVSIMNSSEADFDKLSSAIYNCSGAAATMAEIKLDNFNGQMTLLESATDALKTTIGEAFAPELTALAKAATEIMTGINEFATQNPVLLKSLMAITAEVGAFLLAYKGVNTAKTIGNTLTALGTTLGIKNAAATTAQATATGTATIAQTGLNAAMLANPIGATLVAVAALTVATVTIVSAIRDANEELEACTKASRELKSAVGETQKEYAQTTGEIYKTSEQTAMYISRLKELENQGLDTAVAQREYQIIVDKLNGLYPDLNAQIDENTGLLKDGTKAIEEYAASWKEAAIQEALAKKYQDRIDAWADAQVELIENQAELNVLQTELPSLQAEREKVAAEYSEKRAPYLEVMANSGIYSDEYSDAAAEIRKLNREQTAKEGDITHQIKQNLHEQEVRKKAIEEAQQTAAANEESVRQAESILDSIANGTYSGEEGLTSVTNGGSVVTVAPVFNVTATDKDDLQDKLDSMVHEIVEEVKDGIQSSYVDARRKAY